MSVIACSYTPGRRLLRSEGLSCAGSYIFLDDVGMLSQPTYPLPLLRQSHTEAMPDLPDISRVQLLTDSWTSPSGRRTEFAAAPLHTIPPTRRLQGGFALVQRFLSGYHVSSSAKLDVRSIRFAYSTLVQPNLALDLSVDPDVYVHGLDNRIVDEMMRQLCLQVVCTFITFVLLHWCSSDVRRS